MAGNEEVETVSMIKSYFWLEHQRRICEFREGNDITVISYTYSWIVVCKGKSKIGDKKKDIFWNQNCKNCQKTTKT